MYKIDWNASTEIDWSVRYWWNVLCWGYFEGFKDSSEAILGENETKRKKRSVIGTPKRENNMRLIIQWNLQYMTRPLRRGHNRNNLSTKDTLQVPNVNFLKILKLYRTDNLSTKVKMINPNVFRLLAPNVPKFHCIIYLYLGHHWEITCVHVLFCNTYCFVINIIMQKNWRISSKTRSVPRSRIS